MPTFRITIAYDGTDFVGWQRQASGVSIQGLIEDALTDLDQRAVTVVGAGRTDAGVHAAGQVASFSLNRSIGAEALTGALNARLPDSVRVVTAEPVPGSFHARYAAQRKSYRYRMWNADVLSPFERRVAWHIPGALDRSAMAAAASLLEGCHDFAAFQAAGSSARTTEREIFTSEVIAGSSVGLAAASVADASRADALVIYEVCGNGFLRHMVRTIVGTLVEIGQGRRPVDWMREVLEGRDRAKAGPTAPPQGLVLLAVAYDPREVAADR